MRKFRNYWISDDSPKEGDQMICTQKTNFNFRKVITVTKIQEEFGMIDTDNWKVIVVLKNSPTVEGLLKIKETKEIVYVQSFRGETPKKKLTITLSGGYKVYKDDVVVFETMTPAYAVKTYNEI